VLSNLEEEAKPFLEGKFQSPFPKRGRIMLEFPPLGIAVNALSFFRSIETLFIEIKSHLEKKNNESMLQTYETFLLSMKETWTEAQKRFDKH
jgi:hypothetical protein